MAVGIVPGAFKLKAEPLLRFGYEEWVAEAGGRQAARTQSNV
jgi:hypothetical protein